MKSEEFYIKLKASLEETTSFPAQYMYKFIVPTDEEKTQEVKNLFNHLGAVIETKHSKGGKYTSVSIVVSMSSADAVIEKYKEASTIEGIISL
jgi:putative lipoic acid-binding regulatory protein